MLRIDEIKDDLRKDEGLCLKVYKCPAGNAYGLMVME